MMNLKTKLMAAAFVVVALPVAAQADREDIQLLSQAKISLVEAINIAEKHQGGKAVEATLDDDSFKPAFEVSVVKDDKLFEVHVNSETGEVLGSREDLDD